MNKMNTKCCQIQQKLNEKDVLKNKMSHVNEKIKNKVQRLSSIKKFVDVKVKGSLC